LLEFIANLVKFISMQKIFDAIGITISGTCVMHCLFAPVTLILLPVFGLTVSQEEVLHEIFLYLIVPSAIVAITMGCKKHKDYSVAILATTGIILLVYAVVTHDTNTEQTVEVLTLFGSALVVLSHLRNFLLCRQNDCNHEHD
tara:strand:+ start:36 stop:464 length:429 start_codon:yes stop_codon:yes gene_type:complete